MGRWHWICHGLPLLVRGIPSASFYGDPAGRWKTPASNENLLGQWWIALFSGLLWFVFWQEVKKMGVPSSMLEKFMGCLLDCKGSKNKGSHPVILAESSAAQWFLTSVDIQEDCRSTDWYSHPGSWVLDLRLFRSFGLSQIAGGSLVQPVDSYNTTFGMNVHCHMTWWYCVLLGINSYHVT